MFDPNQLNETRVVLGFLLGMSIVTLAVVIRWNHYKAYFGQGDATKHFLFKNKPFFAVAFLTMFASFIFELIKRDISGLDIWYAALFSGVIVLMFLGMEFLLKKIKPPTS